MPRVTVVIPTFNCARFLGRAVGSVLAQTYQDYEVILVDDGSTDETRDVVTHFADKVRYFYQCNRGPTPARNFALTQSSGELIAYLDADDMWFPNKLEEQVAFLDRHKECGLVHSDVTLIDETDQVIQLRFNRETGRDIPQGYCIMNLLRSNHVGPAVERRECLERTRGFDERVQGVSDYFHWVSVSMDGMAIGYVDEPLSMYRRRAGSLSTNGRQVCEDLVKMFEILLEEKALAMRLGQGAAEIVRSRLHAFQKQLAYLDRTEGRANQARKRVLGLMKESPLQMDLYVELMKTYTPFGLASKLRTLRDRWI